MKRVVIADDEAPMIRVLQQALQRGGFRVQACRNGLEALEAIRQEPPDVLITDIQMPVMSGQVLCQTLTQEYPQRTYPIYVMTSMTDREHRTWTDATPNLRLLEKPLSTRMLLQTLHLYFEQPRALEPQ